MGKVRLTAGLNFAFIYQNYEWNPDKKQGFMLQGSSGSGKTQDALRFLLHYSTVNKDKGEEIFICRETYAACKGTVLRDFIKILKETGMYNVKNHIQSHPQKYIYDGNTFSFGGRDDAAAFGQRNDVVYFNELMLDSDDKAFIQLEGRCRKLFIIDYNPIYTAHFIYDKIKNRPDVHFIKTTFLQCKFLPEGERQSKLSYEPTHPLDRHLPIEQRRPHPVNIDAGTADEYLWRVFGEGEAAAAEGIIFEHVTWIDAIPDHIGVTHAIDFGFTVDPCVIVRGGEDEKNIYIECLSYEAMETPEDITAYAHKIGLNIKIPCVCDSSDRHVSENKGTIEMKKGLRKLGWNIEKVRKTKSVMFWLTSMKKKKIHIVKNRFYLQVLKEKENYRMKSINGVAINQPIDKFNHFWDSGRYLHMSHNQPIRKAFW